ncbi:MAG: hypothetical protein WC753_00110 [Candidatus Gracilibacteria bacterium]
MSDGSTTKIFTFDTFTGIPQLEVPVTVTSLQILSRTNQSVTVTGVFSIPLPQDENKSLIARRLLLKHGRRKLFLPILHRFFNIDNELLQQGLTNESGETTGPMRYKHGFRVLKIEEATSASIFEIVFSMKRNPQQGRPV